MGAIAALMAGSYWTVACSMTRAWQLMGVALGAAQVASRFKRCAFACLLSVTHSIGGRPTLTSLMEPLAVYRIVCHKGKLSAYHSCQWACPGIPDLYPRHVALQLSRCLGGMTKLLLEVAPRSTI